MRINASMRQLLDSMELSLRAALDDAPPGPLPEMVTVDGSVLLADGYKASRSVAVSQFPDRTGYECLVNHFHVPYDGTPAALLHVIAQVAGVQRSLADYAPDRGFLVIVSIAGAESTIRFHECRAGEAWLADGEKGT
jgi:hypothetical protein